jgi:hypothetical protein
MESDYRPAPLSVGHVELDPELLELVDHLARNAHDIWALQRLRDGWILGPKRCDERKEHPCLRPYPELPDTEKAYDRNAVVGTIRAILALGFVIRRE